MKARTKKTRFIPADATEKNYPEAKLVAYLYDTDGGPTVIVYKGRQVKPRAHYAFQSEEARAEWLAMTVKQATQAEQEAEERRKTPHGLNVGDILFERWGFEQTNVHFFEVVRVPSEITATVREIKSEKTDDSAMSMTGRAVPLPGEFVEGSEPINRRAWGDGELSPLKRWRGMLRRWDGCPVAYSSYG